MQQPFIAREKNKFSFRFCLRMASHHWLLLCNKVMRRSSLYSWRTTPGGRFDFLRCTSLPRRTIAKLRPCCYRTTITRMWRQSLASLLCILLLTMATPTLLHCCYLVVQMWTTVQGWELRKHFQWQELYTWTLKRNLLSVLNTNTSNKLCNEW